ncbi:GntR family transcriptional regulator [Paractinoplanes lichenicola]|uniref:GntR family transcriptional regulator n=1 Tax=Paractinoplanes lichenicola TaxID=2802976 RepID=A0ABS1VXE1_9ACTN|nr:GntR family transcriptional regulator [Actinoplanes lichenicola]MBL7259157.1 GntR family transcriptional regulator [Actinoplanes lichenicola]
MIENQRPQYAQIADLIRTRIQDGTYAAGSLLPSEDRLASEFGVSRVTVNRAVGLLRSSGDVKVRRGAGTTVRSVPRIYRDSQSRYAARQEGTGAGEVEVRKLNLKSRTDYRHIGEVETPPAVAAALGLDTTDRTLLRSRVLYANDEPTQIADSYFPWPITKKSEALMQANAGPGGSYGRLADLGYGVVRFSEDVTARPPTEPEYRTLGLDPSQWVFEIWHIAYTAADMPVEACIHVMPCHLWTLGYAWRDKPVSDER